MLSETLLDVIKKGIQSPWSEWEIRDRVYAEEFTFSAIRGFLDAEKRSKRAEAAKTAKARQSKDWHGRENPRPLSRQGKEYSPTSSSASYAKVSSVSNPPIVKVQQVTPPVQVQTPSMQQIQTTPVQQVEPPPIQQFQPPIELAPAFAPAPKSSIEPAPKPAVEPAPEPAPASQSTGSLLPRQPTVSISSASTYKSPTYIPAFEMLSLIPTFAPQSALQQSPLLTPQFSTSAPQAKTQQSSSQTPHRATYTATFGYTSSQTTIPLITFTFLRAAVSLTAFSITSGCISYKKGMG